MDYRLLPYQVKSFPFEIKSINEEDSTFEGYASVFGNVDAYDEVIDKGAFAKTIQENTKRIKICWNHFWDEPIGRPITLEEDNHGLYTIGKVSNTTRGKDILTLMRDGVVTEMSIGFETMQDKNEKTTEGRYIRHLTEVRLWEYSPVTWAANDLALITGVRGFSNNPFSMKLGVLTDFARYAKGLIDLNEGRVLGEANMKLVKSAVEALQALLSEPQPDDESTGELDVAANSGEADADIQAEIKKLLDGLKDAKNAIKR